MQKYRDKYEQWINLATDSAVLQSLQAMQDDSDEIQSAFYKDLEFGTGGLRGIMSAGTNRMNVYTIKRTTEGLAKYMLAEKLSSCAITFDSRFNSDRFAKTAAATLASYGIKVYITKTCMPTPFLSFLVRYYKCDAGINITASHNPGEYNGYKVYDCSGCQLTDAASARVMEHIASCKLFEGDMPDFDSYLGKNITYVDGDAENAYVESVLNESLGSGAGIKVAYTPLNGVGFQIVPRVLNAIGVTDLAIVKEQSFPDGSFATCPYPNPEKKDALTLAIKLAEETNADAVIATDPDSDRLGVCVRHDGKIVQLGGNEVGVLMCDYILSMRKAQNTLPQNPVVVKTIVSTMFIDAIAKKYNVEVKNVLTGFKYIGDVVNKLERDNRVGDYVFGFEESCGYLKGSYARDKDGIVSSMIFAECVAYYKRQGKTVIDRLHELEQEFGVYSQLTVSYRFDGVVGEERKNAVLNGLRTNPLEKLGDSDVVDICDFFAQTKYDLPKSNVLRYNSADGSQLIIRPSGTEPLIKCYMFAHGEAQENEKKIRAITAQLKELFT